MNHGDKFDRANKADKLYIERKRKEREARERLNEAAPAMLAALQAWVLTLNVHPTERTYYINKAKELTRAAIELAEKGSAE